MNLSWRSWMEKIANFLEQKVAWLDFLHRHHPEGGRHHASPNCCVWSYSEIRDLTNEKHCVKLNIFQCKVKLGHNVPLIKNQDHYYSSYHHVCGKQHFIRPQGGTVILHIHWTAHDLKWTLIQQAASEAYFMLITVTQVFAFELPLPWRLIITLWKLLTLLVADRSWASEWGSPWRRLWTGGHWARTWICMCICNGKIRLNVMMSCTKQVKKTKQLC